MSHHSHELTPPSAERFDPKHAGGLPSLLLAAGLIGCAGSLIACIFWRERFAYSWLFAFIYFFTLSVGGLFWVLLHHATDAEWSVVVRRQMENIAILIPAFAVLFLPLLLFCHSIIWKWWDKQPGDDPLLDAKAGYLNHEFFLIRFVLYFVLLGGTAWLIRSHSVKQDHDGLGRHSWSMRGHSVRGLLFFGVALTFAAVDWLMGLNYHWFSTMWGVYIFAGSAGSSMSLLVIIVTVLRNRGYLKPVTMEHYHIMGKFMLTFTIFWAYIGFAQYMLIWYANIPEESIYFLVRNTESWNIFSTFLVVGRFFLPFAILLTQWVKKHPSRLCLVAGWVLLMQLLDMYIVVLPSIDPTGFNPLSLPFDLLAFVGIGGLIGWLWFRYLGSANLFPTRDPRLAASIKLTN